MRPSALPLLLVLAATPLPSLAQQVPASLTLDEALRIARENHPSYGVQRARLDAAHAQERSSAWWLSFVPMVSLSSSGTLTRSSVRTGTDEFGRPVTRDETLTFVRRDADFGPDIGTITLFDGGTAIRNSRSSRAAAQSSRASVAADAVQFEGQLVRAYYAAVQAERRVELEARLLESARLNAAAAERLLRIGLQDPLDQLSAQLSVADAEGRLDLAVGDERKARLALADAMGLPRETGFTLAQELPEVFDPATIDVEELTATALGRSPGVAQSEAVADQQRYDLLNQRMGQLPTVNLSLSTRRGNALGSGSDALFYLNPLNSTYIVSLNVRYNLFDRFQASSRIAQSRASYAAATENLRARRLQTETEVRNAVLDLENVYRSLGRLELRSELSRQQLEMAQEKYRLGSLSFRDLQSAFDTAYQAEYDALQRRFEFVTALLALQEAAGSPTR